MLRLLVLQMERSLQRNNSAHRFSSEQAYRLQQSFLVGSTQDLLDRYLLDLLDSIATLERHSEPLASDVQRDVQTARALMQDAENSRQVITLHVTATLLMLLMTHHAH